MGRAGGNHVQRIPNNVGENHLQPPGRGTVEREPPPFPPHRHLRTVFISTISAPLASSWRVTSRRSSRRVSGPMGPWACPCLVMTIPPSTRSPRLSQAARAMDQPALPTDTSSSRPGQGHHGIGGQCLLVAQPVPVAAAVRLGAIGKIGLVPLTHIEKATQETHLAALDPVPQQGGGRHLEILAQQIQQRRFVGGDYVDTGTEVKGLLPPHIVLDVGGKPVSDLLEGIL